MNEIFDIGFEIIIVLFILEGIGTENMRLFK